MDPEEITVGIGEFAVHHNPTVLKAVGLGSCVGVILYDKLSHIGGLAHIMLPNSKEYTGKIDSERSMTQLMKYADVAIPKMADEMVKLGAHKSNIHAKIVGGAQMFPTLKGDLGSIGQQNIESVKRVLKDRNISLDAEDIGGNYGRSITFEIENQKVIVKTINGIREV